MVIIVLLYLQNLLHIKCNVTVGQSEVDEYIIMNACKTALLCSPNTLNTAIYQIAV